jgi:capsular polysaccharide transport system permease protein
MERTIKRRAILEKYMLSAVFEPLRRLGLLFALTVAMPFLAALLYFGVFASDVYLSESQFVVRSPEKQAPVGLGVLLSSAGVGSAGDESSAAQQYVQSRDALRELNRNDAVAKAYGRREISIFDRFNPLGWSGTFEDLYRYFSKHVEVEAERASAITKLTVRAYSAEDARKINQRLLELSEDLVNRLNERAQADLIRYAQKEVDEAEERAANAAVELAKFRNARGVLDPEKQAQVQLQMISKLQDELISTKTRLAELRAFTPQNSQIPVLNTRVRELSGEIDEQLGLVAGSNKSLSSVAAQYQRLQLESQFADRQLTAAIASLNEAKNDARRKRVYVERIVQPNLPDEALEPRRIRGIFATLVLGLIAWGVFSLLLAGMREHND